MPLGLPRLLGHEGEHNRPISSANGSKIYQLARNGLGRWRRPCPCVLENQFSVIMKCWNASDEKRGHETKWRDGREHSQILEVCSGDRIPSLFILPGIVKPCNCQGPWRWGRKQRLTREFARKLCSLEDIAGEDTRLWARLATYEYRSMSWEILKVTFEMSGKKLIEREVRSNWGT